MRCQILATLRGDRLPSGWEDSLPTHPEDPQRRLFPFLGVAGRGTLGTPLPFLSTYSQRSSLIQELENVCPAKWRSINSAISRKAQRRRAQAAGAHGDCRRVGTSQDYSTAPPAGSPLAQVFTLSISRCIKVRPSTSNSAMPSLSRCRQTTASTNCDSFRINKPYSS
jgi:hypothetical protein